MPLKNYIMSVLRSALVGAGLVLAVASLAPAQSILPADQKSTEKLEPLAEEMRIKRQISYAQKEHKQNLDRARQLSTLGAEIGTTFKEKNQLERADFKKLDKLEKLTKSIRSAAGGSDDAFDVEKIPSDLPSVVSKMAEMAAALKDEVEKTPRRVISTAVIDQANVLLELIRRVRDLSART